LESRVVDQIVHDLFRDELPVDIVSSEPLSPIPPGKYTAQVRGKAETTGIGVVQVYFLQ
jgi:hypothetical protein